jgi:hypothetical protein
MEKGWQPVATAPAHVELELSIYDKGEYHALAFPCQRDDLGWRDGGLIVLCRLIRPIGGCGIADALTENRIS